MKSRRILSLILILMFIVPVIASCSKNNTRNGFVFSRIDNENKYSVTGYNGNVTELTIPVDFDNYPVYEIGNNAFYGNDSLVSVTVPDGIFKVGISAFNGCQSLKSISLSADVGSIGLRAFYNTPSLTEIKVGNENSNYKSIDGVLFSADGKTLIKYPAAKNDETYTVPDGVETIERFAFGSSDKLMNIVLPASVRTISANAFEDCRALTAVNLENVETVGEASFLGCISLKTVNLASAVSLGDRAFNDCSAITEVTLGKSLTTVNEYAFSLCSSLATVTFEAEEQLTISRYAFNYCDKLYSVTFGSVSLNIESYAFSGCSDLHEIRYTGTASEWQVQKIGSSGNRYLTSNGDLKIVYKYVINETDE